MKDILVVGELNVDIMLHELSSVPELNKEKIAQRMETVMGSSSAIFACNISMMGMRVAFIGKLGEDDYSKFIINCLHAKNVDTGNVVFDGSLNTGATIIFNCGEDRMMVTYPGTMAHLSFADVSLDALQNARHLHFSSFFIQPAIRPDVLKMMKTARQLGLTTSLDLQWDPDEQWDFDYASILPLVDVFLPNESEILALTGESDVGRAVARLAPHANIIAVKRAGDGCLIAHQGKSFSLPAYLNTEVVDAVGAGDSFNAGFICKFKQGKELRECADFANLMGAISTTGVGGTMAFESPRKIQETALRKFNQAIEL